MKWAGWFLLSCVLAVAQPAPLPAGSWSITENSGSVVRGSWSFVPASSSFEARWFNGSSARLRLESWDGTRLRITRLETSGPTAGLRTVYEGRKNGSWVEGQVTWYWPGGARQGVWTARLPEEAPESP